MGRLFWKFFFFIWLAQLAVIVGIGGVLWLKDRNQRNQWAEINMGPPAFAMVEIASLTLQHGGVPALRQLLEKPAAFPVLAVNDQGQELLARPVNAELLAQATQFMNSSPAHATVRQASSPDGKSYLLFLPRTSNSPGEPGFFSGGRPPPPNPEHFLPLVPMATALFASLILAFFLAWYFAKPIRSLRSAFASVAQGNLSVRIAASMGGRRDELADLGRDFDHMADQLQALMEGQRRLLHDVSHEMRSPLARLQVAIGLARQQPGKWEASMLRIERESERMDTLVGELLTLSRLEGGVSGSAVESIPMPLLIADAVEDARFEAEACGRQIELDERCPEITLHGQPELLQRALENILRNAIRHTPEGSCVRVQTRMAHKPERLILQVLDHGPGVAENELEAIFEAFYRGEMPTGNGYGLGLAIARRVVATHGGQIRASNRPEGGLCVEISLPLEQR